MKKIVFPLLVLQLSACGAKAGNQTSASGRQAESAVTEVRKVAAPEFKLEDINGNMLSLSDLRGKWVILDFWGSWCPWCIKGFPALKDAYKEYEGKVEIVGIDCGDTKDVWKATVERYELLWLQVYNPRNSDLTEQYGIQGFPTKFIIDPEGNVAHVTVGENPEFFSMLKHLVK
ncbi:MAG: TlpA family protein disulfide reductase [Muribaculaceae bacterium]|nr:TlpA family protein disulfide reductase [Muribaculaceae bacterium]